VNTLNTDGVQTALPGTSVNYTHAFVAGSSGLVTFATTAISAPTLVGWSEVIYRDTNCNGQIDVGEPTVSAGIAVVAGEQVCLVVKEFIPAAAPIGAQNIVTLTANFSYTNAVPLLSASLSRTDTTTVGNSTSSGLRLTKSVNQATALPGATLIYTITYRNDSTGPLSTLLINDATPAFTTFLSAACAPVPATLTGCTVSSSPVVGAVGSIVWTFTGTLAPTSQGTVTFSVQVNP
jgi:mucin-19